MRAERISGAGPVRHVAAGQHRPDRRQPVAGAHARRQRQPAADPARGVPRHRRHPDPGRQHRRRASRCAPEVIRRHVATQMPFMATERWLMLGVAAGGDRQALHEVIRRHSLAVAEAVSRGEPNDLLDRLAADPAFAGIPAGALAGRARSVPLHRPGRASRCANSWTSTSSRCSSAARPLAADARRRRGDAYDRHVAGARCPLPLLRRGKVREVYEVGRRAPAARRQRPGQRLRRRHARGDPRKGARADPDQRLLVREAGRRGPVPLRHGRRRRDPRPGARPGAAPEPDRRPRHAGAAHRRRCRSSAWCAATSPARPGRSTGRAAPWPASRCRRAWWRATRLEPPIFSPATKAETGHDENVTFDHDGGRARDGGGRGGCATPASRVYEAGRDHAAARGIIIADTKFEFGTRPGRHPAPDRRGADARLLPVLAGRPLPAGPRPAELRQAAAARLPGRCSRRQGEWNGEAPPPPLPRGGRGRDQRALPGGYRRLTGHPLPEDG